MRRDFFEYRPSSDRVEPISLIDRNTRSGRARARDLKRSFEIRSQDMCSMELDQIDTDLQVHSAKASPKSVTLAPLEDVDMVEQPS